MRQTTTTPMSNSKARAIAEASKHEKVRYGKNGANDLVRLWIDDNQVHKSQAGRFAPDGWHYGNVGISWDHNGERCLFVDIFPDS